MNLNRDINPFIDPDPNNEFPTKILTAKCHKNYSDPEYLEARNIHIFGDNKPYKTRLEQMLLTFPKDKKEIEE